MLLSAPPNTSNRYVLPRWTVISGMRDPLMYHADPQPTVSGNENDITRNKKLNDTGGKTNFLWVNHVPSIIMVQLLCIIIVITVNEALLLIVVVIVIIIVVTVTVKYFQTRDIITTQALNGSYFMMHNGGLWLMNYNFLLSGNQVNHLDQIWFL